MSLNYEIIRHQWDPVKNKRPFPDNSIENNHIIGKWKCEKGHFWYETIENRVHYQNCHICHSPRRATEVYNLAYLRPDIAQDWHPTKNKWLTPEDVTPGSGKKAWWICNSGHEWIAAIEARTSGDGCPECKNRKVGKDNNLAVLYPNLLKEWNDAKNGDLKPQHIVAGSTIKVWWVCEKGHEWQAKVLSRSIQNRGCVKCLKKESSYLKKKNKTNLRNIHLNSANAIFKKLSREWHSEKNGIFKLQNVPLGSHRKAWWVCEKGHEWEAQVKHRAKGVGCPECSNQKVGKDNNLAIMKPDIAKEWHPDLNKNLTPQNITPGSGKKVWWLCRKGHEWEAQIVMRAKYHHNCPECSNRKVGKDNNLSLLKPDIAKQWHPTKNGSLNPSIVTPGAHKLVWWQCEKGHDWQAQVYGRTKSQKCPVCIKIRNIKINRLKEKYPRLCSEWHPTKNVNIDLSEVAANSAQEVWWLCRKGHEWKDVISSRTRNKSKCPNCTHNKIFKDNNLAIIRPDLVREWHPTKNKLLTPYQVTPGSGKKVWWLCKKGHEWEAQVYSRKDGRNCPECCNFKAGKDNNLSLLRPDIASQWHPIKNKLLTPYQVTPGSGKKVWWLCKKGHEWQAIVANRSLGHGCLECSNQKAGKDNNLAVLRPDLIVEWHHEKNDKLTPYDVVPGSEKKVWWQCEKGHEWEAQINSRAKKNHGCSECSNQKVGKDNNLAIIRPDLVREWHPILNGNLTPYDVVPGSHKRAWWRCSKGHEWNTIIKQRAKNGTGCPMCPIKTAKDYNNLAVLYPELVKEWHHEKNSDLTAFDVIPGSHKKVWWICSNSHEWEALVKSRAIRGHGCRECYHKGRKKYKDPIKPKSP